MRAKSLKESKGITLIALVITIIVLLILAAVSIATLTGENGILTKAQTAKKETEEGQEEEQVRLAQAEANMNDKETEYAGIKIPAGMAPTRAEGESTIDEGLVAVDKNGNEWVWVKVPISEIMKDQEKLTFTSDNDYTTLTTALKTYASSYTKGTASQEYQSTDEWYEGCGVEDKDGKDASEVYKEMYQKMLKGIYDNEGFWIGRYEAGIEGTTGIDEASLAKARTSGTNPIDSTKAICQRDAIPYNFVTVSQAEKLAEAMSPDESKTSSLLFGIQWDLVCKFLEVNSDLDEEDINSNSESWGNYKNTNLDNLSSNAKGVIITDDYNITETWSAITIESSYDEDDNDHKLLSTGASEQTKKLNIYDLAGNQNEYTLEYCSSVYPSFCQGGSFGSNSKNQPASFKQSTTPDVAVSSRAFRPTLY